MNQVETNLQKIQNQITQDIKLIAVTKYATLEQMREIIEAGVTDLGESKVQELEKKRALFGDLPLTWHLIGHLQTNKVKKAVENADFIQSVDSLRLLQKIDENAKLLSKKMPVLLQVNIAKEPNKFGFAAEELLSVEKELFAFSNVEIKGIMFIAPYLNDEVILRGFFRKAKELYDFLQKRYNTINTLSMGMSHDFPLAIAEGATMIRIGSGIFE